MLAEGGPQVLLIHIRQNVEVVIIPQHLDAAFVGNGGAFDIAEGRKLAGVLPLPVVTHAINVGRRFGAPADVGGREFLGCQRQHGDEGEEKRTHV